MSRRTLTRAWWMMAMLIARLRLRSSARPTRRAGELRVGGHEARRGLVEHRQPRRPPAPSSRVVRAQGARRLLALPRAQQVALAQQLGAEAAVDADAPDQQPLQDQQPDAAGSDPAGAADSGRQRPRAMLRTSATHSSTAWARSAGGIASASSGSSLRTWQTVTATAGEGARRTSSMNPWRRRAAVESPPGLSANQRRGR